MAAPRTPLLGAPSQEDAFGQTMLSEDIIKGLRRINPNIVVPLPEHYKEWYPFKAAGGTCLWLGKPGEGVKITAMHLGAVPEWTQLCPEGILAKGWRAIFDRVIKARAATRAQIEREFRVSLTYSGSNKECPRCFQAGIREKSSAASGLCDKHEYQRKIAVKARAFKEDRKEMKRRPVKRMGPSIIVPGSTGRS